MRRFESSRPSQDLAAEIVNACLERIAQEDRKLGSFVTVFGDSARVASEAADKAIAAGQRLSPLHGLPVAVKDIIEIEGAITSGGAGIWKH